MRVFVKWRGMRGVEVARSRRAFRAVDRGLAVGPAVVAARSDDVHLFPEIAAHIAAPHFARGWVDGKAPRIAQPGGPHFGADIGRADGLPVEGSGPDERIVRRDRVGRDEHAGPRRGFVARDGGHGGLGTGQRRRIRMRIGFEAARLSIHIEAQHGGVEVSIDPLGVVVKVVLPAFVAERDVEVAVRAEVQVASVVIARVVPLLDEDFFRSGVGCVGVARRGEKAGDPLVEHARFEDGVKDEELPVRGVGGVKSHAEQSALATPVEDLAARCRDIRRKIQKRRDGWIRRGDIGDQAQQARLFADKEALGLAGGCAQADRLVKSERAKGWGELVGGRRRGGGDIHGMARDSQPGGEIDCNRSRRRRPAAPAHPV